MSREVVPGSESERAGTPAGALGFIGLAGRLTKLPRTGWTRFDIPRPESVAAHSFRAAIIGYVLAPRFGANPERTALMLTFHDFNESIIGDIVTDGGEAHLPNRAQKLSDERTAAVMVADMIGDTQLLELFDEFEAGKTPEALLARQVDGIEMAAQAREYELAHGLDLSEFYVSARRKVIDPYLSTLLEQVIAFEG